jgi:hypothetical protein
MRPGSRKLWALILLAAVAVFFIVAPAAARAVLLESNLLLQSAVSGTDIPIKLRFNVCIGAVRSRLTLMRPDGSARPLGISKQAPSDTLLDRSCSAELPRNVIG